MTAAALRGAARPPGADGNPIQHLVYNYISKAFLLVKTIFILVKMVITDITFILGKSKYKIFKNVLKD